MNRQAILYIILAVVLGYAAYTYWPLVSPYFPGAPQGVSQPPVPAVTIPPAAVKSTPEAQAAVSAEAHPTREVTMQIVDPFVLRVSVRKKVEAVPGATITTIPAPPAEPKLEGVWIDPQMRIAFISGQALPVGGTILGWRVTSIQKDRVLLQKESAVKILRMEEK